MQLPILVGDRIRELRKAKGWTQENLAEASTIHYSYIGGIERGDRNISLETLEKIIIALNVSPTEIFRFEFNKDADLENRRQAIDEHMTMINSRTTDEIKTINKINRDIFSAIDSKWPWTREDAYIGAVERGERNFTIDMLEKIHIALRVDATDLFQNNTVKNNDEVARQRATDEFITMISNLKSDQIEVVKRINKELVQAFKYSK